MKKEKLQKLRSSLKAINDMYVLVEEAIDWEVDKASGVTKEVAQSLIEGKLVIPEMAEFYAKKYPCVGKVVAHGDRVKYIIPIGTRVVFARLGVQRDQIDGKDYVFVRECDLHAILD